MCPGSHLSVVRAARRDYGTTGRRHGGTASFLVFTPHLNNSHSVLQDVRHILLRRRYCFLFVRTAGSVFFPPSSCSFTRSCSSDTQTYDRHTRRVLLYSGEAAEVRSACCQKGGEDVGLATKSPFSMSLTVHTRPARTKPVHRPA